MKIKEGLEIKTYQDYKKHQIEIFNIISDVIDLAIKETADKNPTFLIPDYDKLVNIHDLRL